MKVSPVTVLTLYTLAAGLFFIIDLAWLGTLARGIYARHVGSLLREQVLWPAAAIFYAIYIGGLLLFVLLPAVQYGYGPWRTAILGGALGLFAYATFDLTCLALIRGWSPFIAVVDLIWGTLLTGTTAALTLVLTRWILKAQG